jgi:DNA-binding SARP family transcriptional activator/tetratricopeptide (TPR) repeat protein
LAALLSRAGQPVTADELAEHVWDSNPPPGAADTLRTVVMRLRRTLGPQAGTRIVTRGRAYLLEVEEDEVDALRFASCYRIGAAAVRAVDWTRARVALADGLALWRGIPLADVPSQSLRDSTTPVLDQMRLQALHWRIDADLRFGTGDDLVPELHRLIAEQPLREHFHAQLMIALSQGGRTAEALAAFQHARELLVEQLGIEPGPELRDLHQRALRGEQLAPTPGSPRDASPVSGEPLKIKAELRAVPQQLPAADRYFTGRLAELTKLDGLADASSQACDRDDQSVPGGIPAIAVISGTAGAGKTTLALRWAHQVTSLFPDGQLYVNLRGFDPAGEPMSSRDALTGFLDALAEPGARLPADIDAQAALYRSLTAGRRILVVLDNACDEEQARPLLPGSGGCVAIVTSRAKLTGLVATNGAVPVELDVLSDTEASGLLRRRLGARRLAAEPAATEQLVRVCARLPLALSLAAARAAINPSVPLADLAEQINDLGLDALSSADPRTDLRKVLSWSYRQLSPDAAWLFRHCVLFPGPDFTAAAAASAVPGGRAADLITELTDAHLLNQHVPGRYRMHDLLASYARECAERVDTAAERADTATRILKCYLAMSAAAAQVLKPKSLALDGIEAALSAPATPLEAIAWFEAERVNLVAAVGYAAQVGADAVAAALPRTLSAYFDLRARWQDWLDTFATGIAAARRAGDRDSEAHLLTGLALPYVRASRAGEAIDCLNRALAIRQAEGNRAAEAGVLGNMSNVYFELGRVEEAVGAAEQAIVRYRESGNRANEARGLSNLGWYYMSLDRLEESLHYQLAALALTAETSDPVTTGIMESNLAHVYLLLGRFGEAIAAATAAVKLNEQLGARVEYAQSNQVLGDALDATGDHARARQYWLAALEAFEDLHDSKAAGNLRDRLQLALVNM